MGPALPWRCPGLLCCGSGRGQLRPAHGCGLGSRAPRPLLHRLHNLESRYFFALARSDTHPVRKAFYFLEGVRFRFLEQRLFSRAIHLCISTEECETVAAAYPGLAFWLPPALAAMPKTAAPLREEVRPHFLVTGSLNLPDTWQGVRWLLERLWPPIRRELPHARLTVAGRRPEPKAAAFLEQTPGLRVCYDVPDMTPLFQEAEIYLSPILQGAGVKIKTVEALSHGLPVVATPVAAQGCGLVAGEHLLVARDESEFVAACVRLATDRELRHRLAAAGQNTSAGPLITRLACIGFLPLLRSFRESSRCSFCLTKCFIFRTFN